MKINKFFSLILLFNFMLQSFLITPGYAGAGYLQTRKGEIIRVKSCIPSSTQSPLQLQIGLSSGKWKNLTNVSFKSLKQANCSISNKELVFIWRVSVANGGGLRFWDMNRKAAFVTVPDGISIS
jgi:hypothetical protein